MAAHTTAILPENLRGHACAAPNRNQRRSHEVCAHAASHWILSRARFAALVSGACWQRALCVWLIAVCNRLLKAKAWTVRRSCEGVKAIKRNEIPTK
jgi:hypothetical protein